MVKKVGNGFVVSPKDIDSLKYYLNLLINDEPLRKEMSEKSKSFTDAYDKEVGIKPFVDSINFALKRKNNKLEIKKS